jgi:hypothetical protein
MAPPVIVRPWVMADVRTAVTPASDPRAVLGQVLFDLYNHLPGNLAILQTPSTRISPRCFWYKNTYSLSKHTFQLRKLDFVIRDADLSMLEVIWVVVAA